MIHTRALIGSHNIIWITLDTLRHDVAVKAMSSGNTPQLARWLPNGQWERRHSPGSFTFAAHQAFFAGFLPTPVEPGLHPRLFAASFPGSETTSDQTYVFDSGDVVSGLAHVGYHTICIGGVGFFNKRTPLGRVLPDLFQESHWHEGLGVTDPDSTRKQVALALQRVAELDLSQRYFLFINVSAMHQPNCIFAPPASSDSPETQLAALAYADEHLGQLIHQCTIHAPALVVIMSDHGTAYGEEGYHGHRLGHAVVWDVPYAEFVVGPSSTTVET